MPHFDEAKFDWMIADLTSDERLYLIRRLADSLSLDHDAAKTSEADIITAQRACIDELQRRLVDLPVKNAADGFSGASHNEYLYGNVW